MARTWTDEQKRVIAQNNSNLLVSAAAGSGKTAVMVERIIQRILDEKHPVDIDRIVVVTFTKAAAAQMKERIAAALSSVMLSEKNEKRVVLIRRQLALLENAVICTIDSFCNYILRNYFNTIDLDPSYRIGDEGELKLLMSDVADEVIEEAYSCGDKAFLEFVDGQLPAPISSTISCAVSTRKGCCVAAATSPLSSEAYILTGSCAITVPAIITAAVATAHTRPNNFLIILPSPFVQYP